MYRQEVSAVRRIGQFAARMAAAHKAAAGEAVDRTVAAGEAAVRKLAPEEAVDHKVAPAAVAAHTAAVGEAAVRMIAAEEVHIAAEEGVVEQTCSVPEPDLKPCRKLYKTVRRPAAELRNLGILP